MSEESKRQKKEYVGLIWIDDQPGLRISVWAHDAEEAARKVEEQYGSSHPFSIRNLGDANRPR